MRAQKIRDVEHVDGALAERRDVGRRDVEAQLRQRRGELIEQARTVETRHLDDGVTVRPLIVDQHFWLDRKGLEPVLGRRAFRRELGQARRA